MIEWSTNAPPQGKVILAKIAESFNLVEDNYDILVFHHRPYPHYRDGFNREVPDSVIEKWATIL